MYRSWAKFMNEDSGYDPVPGEYTGMFEPWLASNSASPSSTETYLTTEAYRATIKDELRAELKRRG